MWHNTYSRISSVSLNISSKDVMFLYTVTVKWHVFFAAKFESYGYCDETHVVVRPPGI